MKRACAAIALCLVAGSLRIVAQDIAPVVPAPRMPDGKPDLTGVYQASTRRGPWDAEVPGEEAGVPAPRTPGQVVAASEPPPLRPDALKRAQELLNRRSIDDPTGYCFPQAGPRMHGIGLFPIQFVQRPEQLIILYEYFGVFRVIPIDGRGHPDDIEPAFMGNSAGRWDGDTLVVDVAGFKEGGWLAAGVVHSDALRITERYTRVDRDQMNYEAVIEDPNVFTRPWTVRRTLMLREGARVREYVCAENNLDPARYQEYLKRPSLFMRSPDEQRPR